MKILFLTFSIQQPRDSELVVGNIEGIVEVVNVPGRLQLVKVYQVRPVSVDQSVET